MARQKSSSQAQVLPQPSSSSPSIASPVSLPLVVLIGSTFSWTYLFPPLSSPASSILNIFLEQASWRAFGLLQSVFLSFFLVFLWTILLGFRMCVWTFFPPLISTRVFFSTIKSHWSAAVDCRWKAEISKSICINLTSSCVISHCPASLQQLSLSCAEPSNWQKKISVFHCLRNPWHGTSSPSTLERLRNITSFFNEFSQNDGCLMRI